MATGLTQADKDAVNKVLDSGMLRAHKKCEEFEQRFGAMSAAKHAMTCANGTIALQLAYEPLFQRGDDVLVPAWTFIATVSMVIARGGNPIFVDADPKTGQMDLADAARKVTKKTTAITPTHLYGCPVDIDAVQALAKQHNLKVVYDAAQAHLATYKGRGIGAFGDAVTYSFYATKNLMTGEGGMVTCNDDALARSIKLLRSHGETDKYLHESVGYNYRLNDMAGAIGCSRLDRLEAETNQRRSSAARYEKILVGGGGIEGIEPIGITPGAVSAYHLYTVKMDLSRFTCTRDEFVKALGAEGVPTAVHYPRPLTEQPAFKAFVTDAAKQAPAAKALSQQVFCLPMHHALTDEHFRVMEEALKKVTRAMQR
jgi:perosamine synthetase